MGSPMKLVTFLALLLMAGPAVAQQANNCTRATIVEAISSNPQWSTVTSAISALNATFLLPNEARNGTLFLPVNSAFAALNISTATLLSNYSGQLLSILAYHSLLNQNKTFNRAGLLAASPLQTDLGALVSAGAGRNVSLPVSVTPGVKHKAGTTGLENVSGRVANDTGRLRGVVRTCGLIIYESDVVLLPAAIANVPDALAYFGGMVPANIDSATSPGGLAAAVASGNLKVASVPYNGTTGAGSGNDANTEGSTVGSSNTTGARGATAAVAGQALSLNGTGGTLSSTSPVLLLGTVTPSSGAGNGTSGDNDTGGDNGTSAGNSTAPALGPGLIYLNGTVQDGVGVNGTATLVRSLSPNGAVLSRATTPLTGAMVNGTAFDAAGTTIRAATGTGNGTRQANSTTGGTSNVSDMDGFGSALTQNGNGTFNATAGMLVLLDGFVTNGTAVNATAATGIAAMGDLGPGAILINGTVNDSQGVSGTAYPVVAATPLGILVDLDNAVNITGATLSGTGFNATGLTTRQQAATAAGGAGAASAGSPGVPPSGNSTTGGNATTGAAGAAAAAVAGQALSLNGTGGTLSSTSPVLLLGTVTSSSGASNGTSGDSDTDNDTGAGNSTTGGNGTATALGPGLIYLNGTVQDGVGVNGTATLVRSLSRNGAVLTRASVPLMGAMVNGTAFDAAGTMIRTATGTANGTRQANSTTGVSTVVAVAGFGSSLTTGANGTFNATAGMPVLLDGNVTDGTAINATGATGDAAMGNLGPGAILVNGTVTNGQGVSGTAYPVVAATSTAIVVNRDNAVNITGATLSGMAFNATGITTRQQAATAAGGAGAASSGSPGVPPAGGSTASAPSDSDSDSSSGLSPGSASGSPSGSASGSAAPAPAPQSAPTTSSAAALPLATLAAASLLLAVA